MAINYIDNTKFLEAIKKHRENVKDAEYSGKEIPKIPDYIGRCILDISTNLARRPNFNGYTYKDEMISDGYEHCIRYFYNFDPEKSNNPFGYFTTIIYYAFLRRLEAEKKQSRIKSGMIINSGLFNMLVAQQESDTANYDEHIKEFLKDYIDNDVLVKEEKKKQKKVSVPVKKQKGLDEFFDSNGEIQEIKTV